MRGSIILTFIVLVLVVLTGMSSLFIVQQTEQALVIEFGQLVRVVQTPGLALKAPWQTVYIFDKRILELDADPEEVIASDRRRIVVDAFARYRISDALRYYQSMPTEALAKQRLSSILSSSLRGVLGQRPFASPAFVARTKAMTQTVSVPARHADSN